MEYYLKGDTYAIKEELKAHRCFWDEGKRAWRTPYLEKDSERFKRIESICLAFGIQMIPVQLTGECKTVQEILSRRGGWER